MSYTSLVPATEKILTKQTLVLMMLRTTIMLCTLILWQGCSTSQRGGGLAAGRVSSPLSTSFHPYQAQGTEFGYRVLELENRYGSTGIDEARRLLDSLVGEATAGISPKTSYTKPEAVALLQRIHRVLAAYGIQYASETLFSTGLHEHRLDCDLLSYVYLTVADVLHLPIYGMQAPRHFLVMWDDGNTTLLWEATNGRAENRDYYINSPTKGRIVRSSLEQGVYLRKLSRDESLAVAMVSIGRNLYEKKKNDAEVLELYTESLRKHPRNAIAYNNRGNTYERMGSNQQAIADHTRAIELDPNYALAYTNRGVAHMSIGNAKQAIADHSKCITLDGGIAQAYFNRAYAYARANRLNEAYSDYTRAIGLDGSMAKAYYNRANVAQKQGNSKQAISDYTQALQLNPRYTEALYNRGVVYQEQKQYERAIRDYAAVIAQDPNDVNALHNRAACYENMGNIPAALSDYTQLIQRSDTEPDVYYHRAHLYKRQKDYAHALRDFNQAIERNTKEGDYYYWRAVTRSEAGEDKSAVCQDLYTATRLGNKKAAEAQKKYCP